MLWDLTVPAARPEEAETRFTCSSFGLRNAQFTLLSLFTPYPMLRTVSVEPAPLKIELPSSSFSVPTVNSSYHWIEAVQLVADATPAGETRTRQVALAEVYDCWPMELYLDGNGMWFDPVGQAFADYFPIPIPQDYQVEVELATNRLGALYHVVCRNEGHYLFQSDAWSFETPQGYLFTFPNTYFDGQLTQTVPIDGSRLSAGWGLYRLTVNSDSTGGQLETVYSLPEGSEILDFLAGGDKSTFFLLTREEGMLRLRVFDRSIALQDTFDLLPMEEGDHYIQTYWGGDFLVPILYVGGPDSCRLAVVAPGSQGWQPHFTFSLAEQAALGFGGISRQDTSWYPLAMDYAHGRLAIRDGNGGANFYLAVYDGGELAYLGTYESSLTIPAVLETEYDLASSQSSVCYLPRTATLPLVAWPETAS